MAPWAVWVEGWFGSYRWFVYITTLLLREASWVLYCIVGHPNHASAPSVLLVLLEPHCYLPYALSALPTKIIFASAMSEESDTDLPPFDLSVSMSDREPTRWQHSRIYPNPISPCVYTYDSRLYCCETVDAHCSNVIKS